MEKENAQFEAEIVKKVAKEEAAHKDMMEKPLASHYDYASNFIDGLMEGWGYLPKEEGTESLVENIHDKAKHFSQPELDLFMDVIAAARENIERAHFDIARYLDELVAKKDSFEKGELRKLFEESINSLYIEQESYIRNWCMKNSVFKREPEKLDALIRAFLVNKPIIHVPNRHRSFLGHIYADS